MYRPQSSSVGSSLVHLFSRSSLSPVGVSTAHSLLPPHFPVPLLPCPVAPTHCAQRYREGGFPRPVTTESPNPGSLSVCFRDLNPSTLGTSLLSPSFRTNEVSEITSRPPFDPRCRPDPIPGYPEWYCRIRFRCYNCPVYPVFVLSYRSYYIRAPKTHGSGGRWGPGRLTLDPTAESDGAPLGPTGDTREE